MFCGFNLTLFDVDIYAKKIGLFYKKKEKISTYFGFTLTLLYILISVIFFLVYIIQTFKHADLQSYDTTIYSQEVPNINLNHSDLLYFAFAVEIPSTAARFIDETIYTVKAIFYDSFKNENGEFVQKETRDLKVERCKQEKFGKEYQHLFTNGEFNNSYCISDLDLVLHGGFIYDRLSLIRIDLFPCVNSTDNNNHCKPQEIIDQYLAEGYFSLLLKDVGLNPSNYSFPILPTLQDLWTTISKKFMRDLVIFYEITEIRTDYGFFYEKISSQRFLKFNKLIESFIFRSDEKYYNGESILDVQIRLSESIHVQNRIYKKMHTAFATAGGYMQMMNTIFSLLIILPNKFFYDNIIVHNLFDFDKNKNTIVSKNQIKKERGDSKKKFSFDFDMEKQHKNNIKLKMKNKNEIFNTDNKSEKIFNIKKESQSLDKCIDLSANEKMNNVSKIDNFFSSNNLNIINNNRAFSILKNKKSEKVTREISTLEPDNNFIKSNIKIFDYLCIGKFRKKNKNFITFKKGIVFFKQKMDIINIFNYILLNEKKFNNN